MSKPTYFKEEWCVNTEWAKVIAAVPANNRQFFCKICKKANNLSNMGRQAVASHMKSAGLVPGIL